RVDVIKGMLAAGRMRLFTIATAIAFPLELTETSAHDSRYLTVYREDPAIMFFILSFRMQRLFSRLRKWAATFQSRYMSMNNSDKITFSFGENWKDYLRTIDERVLQAASKDIEEWIGTSQIKGNRVVDVGSGSGLSSLCFYHASPAELVSFDYDEYSVE